MVDGTFRSLEMKIPRGILSFGFDLLNPLIFTARNEVGAR